MVRHCLKITGWINKAFKANIYAPACLSPPLHHPNALGCCICLVDSLPSPLFLSAKLYSCINFERWALRDWQPWCEPLSQWLWFSGSATGCRKPSCWGEPHRQCREDSQHWINAEKSSKQKVFIQSCLPGPDSCAYGDYLLCWDHQFPLGFWHLLF